jgi:2-oxoisovalerate dehydrogenase E1 component
MNFDRSRFSDEELLSIYRKLLLPRLIEEKMLLLLRQGKISKWFSGIGQEAIPVGVTHALAADEWLFPLHRNLGVFTGRDIPLHKLFLQWQGSREGFSKGRERSFHFGSAAHRICGMISHLGPQLAIADGAALAHKLRQQKKVAVAFTGEGGTSEGDFHEALNLAAVWDLPVIFVIENNGYALSTPTKEQYRCKQLTDKAIGYGMEAVSIDGNNILTVIDTIRGIRDYCIEHQKPYLVECQSFRMRGHEEASGTKYVPAHLFETWKLKDPVSNFEDFLLSIHLISPEQVQFERNQVKTLIETELELAGQYPNLVPHLQEEIRDVFAVSDISQTYELPPKPEVVHIRFIEAISQGLAQSMEKHPELVIMGQDIAEYCGAFKVTEGFLEKFGRDRIRNTPICESAVIGAALGLSLEGIPSVVEMQFADFVSMGFNQVVNNLAKIHYRWGQNARVVIRMPTGAGVGAGPFHSQSNEAWFFHVPGLKIVYPSNPADAKGLLIAAINDPNPVLYFEHKALYRGISGDVPVASYETPIGKAQKIKEGNDLSIVTYGAAVHWALEYATTHPETSMEILDLRSLAPLDTAAIADTVKHTGKLLVLHEDNLTGGIGAEISAWVSEHCFEWLDAPIVRCASLDTPVPFNLELEKQFLAKSRLTGAVEKLIRY